MKLKIRICLLTFLATVLTATAIFAQSPTPAETAFNKLVQKYDGTAGIDCVVARKGSGLELFKMMFNKQFGKDFMKGVTSITLIDYSSASQDVCHALRKDLDVFLSILDEFDMREDEELAESEYIRSFASVSDSNTISDFVVALEDDSSKMLMYMAGKIVID